MGSAMPDTVAYWLSETTWLVVETNHIDVIRRSPQRFGLDEEILRETFRRHGEEMGTNGRAREELIRRATENGWVRVREDVDPHHHLEIQCHDFVRREATIARFLHRLITEHPPAADLALHVIDFSREPRWVLPWAEGGVRRFLEERRGALR